MDKRSSRVRRSRRTRAKIRKLGANRLSVHRTPRHTYAQIYSAATGRVVASASTLCAEVKAQIQYTGNIDAAITVGKVLADRARTMGIETVAFDRSGHRYHGRIKALANAAREYGLKF